MKVPDKKRIRYNHCQILSKYTILSFVHCFSILFVKLVFKCLNNTAPQTLCKTINWLQTGARSTTCATLKGNCSIPFCKTSFAQTVFSVKGAQLWNSVPDHLKCIPIWNLQKKHKIVANSATIMLACLFILQCVLCMSSFILFYFPFHFISIFLLFNNHNRYYRDNCREFALARNTTIQPSDECLMLVQVSVSVSIQVN